MRDRHALPAVTLHGTHSRLCPRALRGKLRKASGQHRNKDLKVFKKHEIRENQHRPLRWKHDPAPKSEGNSQAGDWELVGGRELDGSGSGVKEGKERQWEAMTMQWQRRQSGARKGMKYRQRRVERYRCFPSPLSIRLSNDRPARLVCLGHLLTWH